jgi:hypothetical protein
VPPTCPYSDFPRPRPKEEEHPTMSMERARHDALARKARQLGCPGNLELASWAMGMEAMVRDNETIMEERHLALRAGLDAATEMARAARDYAREGHP